MRLGAETSCAAPGILSSCTYLAAVLLAPLVLDVILVFLVMGFIMNFTIVLRSSLITSFIAFILLRLAILKMLMMTSPSHLLIYHLLVLLLKICLDHGPCLHDPLMRL